MNNEALSKRMSKLDIEEDKTDATKGIPKGGLVKFTHGVYGTITSGGYKGYDVEIREYIPEKMLVKFEDGSKVYMGSANVKVNKNTGDVIIKKGNMKNKKGTIIKTIKSSVKVIVNAKPEIIDTDNIFYHDISLEGDIICNVLKIERDGNSYKFYVKTLKNDRMIVSKNDIKSYLLGFRINNGTNVGEIEEIPFSEEIAMGDPDTDTYSDTSDTESSIDYGEPEEQLEEEINELKGFSPKKTVKSTRTKSLKQKN
jgi:hypothetical protein